jgi:hypothetical protein
MEQIMKHYLIELIDLAIIIINLQVIKFDLYTK